MQNFTLVDATEANSKTYMRSFVVPGTDEIVFNNKLAGHNLKDPVEMNNPEIAKASQLTGYTNEHSHGGHMNRLTIDLKKVDLGDNEIWIESLFDACPVFHVSIDGYCYPRSRFRYLKSFEIDDDKDGTIVTLEMAPEFLLTFGLKLEGKGTHFDKPILRADLFGDTEFKLTLNVTDAGELVTISIENPWEEGNEGKESHDLTSNDQTRGRVEASGRKKREANSDTVATISTLDALESNFTKLSSTSLRIFNPRERLSTSLASKVQLYSLAFTKAEIDVNSGSNDLLYDVSFGYNNMILSKFLWASPKAIG